MGSWTRQGLEIIGHGYEETLNTKGYFLALRYSLGL